MGDPLNGEQGTATSQGQNPHADTPRGNLQDAEDRKTATQQGSYPVKANILQRRHERLDILHLAAGILATDADAVSESDCGDQ